MNVQVQNADGIWGAFLTPVAIAVFGRAQPSVVGKPASAGEYCCVWTRVAIAVTRSAADSAVFAVLRISVFSRFLSKGLEKVAEIGVTDVLLAEWKAAGAKHVGKRLFSTSFCFCVFLKNKKKRWAQLRLLLRPLFRRALCVFVSATTSRLPRWCCLQTTHLFTVFYLFCTFWFFLLYLPTFCSECASPASVQPKIDHTHNL